MTQDRARTREVDENLFGKTQAQILARRRVIAEQDEIAAAREENTMRLRALRLEREASNPPPVKMTKRAALKALPPPKAADQADGGAPAPRRKAKASVKAAKAEVA